MKKSKIIKILIADDHPLIRAGLRSEIESRENLVVAAEAKTGHEVIELTEKTNPHIILLDISMPGMNGNEVLYIIRKKYPKIKIIVVTMFSNIHFINEMKKLGADGYILKDDPVELLIDSIQIVLTSKKFHIPSANLQKDFHIIHSPEISKREIEIISLISKGFKNREIAEKLFLSRRTVEVHREKLKKKLKLKNTADIIKYVLMSDFNVKI